jgi:hypothetical protein
MDITFAVGEHRIDAQLVRAAFTFGPHSRDDSFDSASSAASFTCGRHRTKISGIGLTLFAHFGGNTPEMELSQLSAANEVLAHEFDVSALQNEVRYQRELIAALIDLLEHRSGSLEFFAGMKALRVERDRIRQGESF